MLDRLNTEWSAYSATETASGWWESHSSHAASSLSSAGAAGPTTVSFAVAERHLARRDHEPGERLVARPPEPDRLVAQLAPLATLATTGAAPRGGHLARAVAEHVVERVVPQAADLVGLRLVVVGELDHRAAEVGEALDVVAVDVADHREVDPQRAGASAQLLEPRPQARLPGLERTAVDQAQLVVDVQQQRVAVERLQRLEREDHAHTAWIARRASTTPLPWK